MADVKTEAADVKEEPKNEPIASDVLEKLVREAMAGDRTELTKRKIRNAVETKLGLGEDGLANQKDEINAIVATVLTEPEEEEEEEEEASSSDDDANSMSDDDSDASEIIMEDYAIPKRKTRGAASGKNKKLKKEKEKSKDKKKRKATGGGFQKLQWLSPELTEVVGTDKLGRSGVMKKLWEYIREHSLQDPNDKRVIMCDDKLKKVMKSDKIGMFAMNKPLSLHFHGYCDDDAQAEAAAERRANGEESEDEVKPKKAKKAKKAATGAGGAPSTSGFNKPMQISETLQSLFNSEPLMSRPQVVKHMWQYIKANDLQKPSDKRMILVDDKLAAVFPGQKEVSAFKMNTYLKDHITKPEGD